jgi:hypothetical protein
MKAVKQSSFSGATRMPLNSLHWSQQWGSPSRRHFINQAMKTHAVFLEKGASKMWQMNSQREPEIILGRVSI